MDNKLSELSKPVAQAYYDEYDSSTMLIDWLVDSVPEAPTALYSQEYVSALEQKIAELEAEITNIVDSHGETVAELRAKLATPVRLVAYRNSPDMHTKQYYEAIGFNQGIDACSVALRAAGFTVEGDE